MRYIWFSILTGCAGGEKASGGESKAEVSVTLSPEAPLTTEDLQVSFRATGTTGAWSVAIRWLKNGAPVGFTEATLPAEMTSKGDVWSAIVTVSDSLGEGQESKSEERTVLNTPPGQPTLAVVPDPPRELHGDLRCVVSEDAPDPDNEAMEYQMVWARNGETFAGGTTSTWPTDTIPSAYLAAGDAWRCTAQAFDGSQEGPPASIETIVSEAPLGYRAGVQSITDADRWFLGTDHMDFFGYELASVGDVTGDDVDDLVMTGHRMEAGGRNRGLSFVLSGAELAAGTTMDPERAARWVIEGTAWYDFSGYAVAGLPDTDGDGLNDVLVSSHNTDEVAFNNGSVGLFTADALGESGRVTADRADTVFVGESLRAYTGYAVASAGDVDGDGEPDVLIGAMGNLDEAPYAGKAYVVRHAEYFGRDEVALGALGTVLTGEHRRAYAGWAVDGVGDIDGDGLSDVVIGGCGTELGGSSEDEDEGAAYLITGSQMAGASVVDLADAERRWAGEDYHDYIGYDVAGMGDLDGDGVDDIGISGLLAEEMGGYPGGVFIILGGEILPSGSVFEAAIQLHTSESDAQFGREISGRGDVDGDGLSDVLVGAMTASEDQSGAAYLWLAIDITPSGVFSPEDAVSTILGSGEAAFLGAGLTLEGDYNGDGLSDLAIGMHNYSAGGAQVGAAGVFFMD